MVIGFGVVPVGRVAVHLSGQHLSLDTWLMPLIIHALLRWNRLCSLTIACYPGRLHDLVLASRLGGQERRHRCQHHQDPDNCHRPCLADIRAAPEEDATFSSGDVDTFRRQRSTGRSSLDGRLGRRVGGARPRSATTGPCSAQDLVVSWRSVGSCSTGERRWPRRLSSAPVRPTWPPVAGPIPLVHRAVQHAPMRPSSVAHPVPSRSQLSSHV